MGTDIHIYFEARDDNAGQWKSTDTWVDEYDTGELDIAYAQRIYNGRNYELFAMLADERNDGNIKPFAPVRGIPTDTDGRIKVAATTCWGEERTSYFTLQELLSFDWAQPVKISKLVGLKDWDDWQSMLEFDASRLPRSWHAGTNGEIISEDEARKLIAKIKNERGGHEQMETTHWRTSVRCEWERPYWFVASEFWGSVIPHMIGLGSPADVRMVFCFG